jgi:FAD synthase
MGAPHLVSFGGMAEVLGWQPKLAVVAEADRDRVLSTWTEICRGKRVREIVVPFAEVRKMSPEEFVRFLRDELNVAGVVAGSDYRFGYRASGAVEDLKFFGQKLGVEVTVVDLVPSGEKYEDASGDGMLLEKDATAQVSSTRVRACLALGDVEQAARLLGRPHRLVLSQKESESEASMSGTEKNSKEVTRSLTCALNQYPASGVYVGKAPDDDETFCVVRVTEVSITLSVENSSDDVNVFFADGVVRVDLIAKKKENAESAASIAL